MSQNVITLHIAGMTCAHCVASITEELHEVTGVSNVAVELNEHGTSIATVTTSAPVEDSALAAAVNEAGYTLVTDSA